MHGRLIARVAAAVATLAALLVGAALTTTAAHAAELDGRVAFGSSDAAIDTIEGDGTRRKTAFNRHTGGEGAPWSTMRLADPAYSPDGRKLAFTGTFFCDGCSLETTKIGIVDADRHQGQPFLVVSAVGSAGPLLGIANPAWTPDGRSIAFEAFTIGGGGYSLYTVPATGGTPVRIEIPARYEDPQQPAFSPDGRLLAFSADDEEGDRRIFVMNRDSGEVTQVTRTDAHQEHPAFSPDSQSVAYVNRPFAPGGGLGYRELAMRSLAGGAQEVLWSNQSEYGRWVTNRPAFSPDGEQIAFSATRTGEPECPAGDVMVVNTTGAANPRAIACGGTSELGNVSWGTRAAQGATKLVSALPGSEREGGDGDSDPAIVTGDGKQAVFVSSATNLDEDVNDNRDYDDVFIRNLITGETQAVSVNEDGRPAEGDSDMAHATPDGEWVAFRSKARNVLAGFEGGDTAVWLRNTRSGFTILASRDNERQRVGMDGENDPQAISADGRYVLFTSRQSSGQTSLYRFDRIEQKTALITTSANPAAFMSADGNTVVFESWARDLVPGFVDRNGDHADIFSRDMTTGTTRLVDGSLASATDGLSEFGQLLGISADGATVLFQSPANDVVPQFTDGNPAGDLDLYVRSLDTRRAFLVTGVNGSDTSSVNHGEALVRADAQITADGRRVFFSSQATNVNTQFTVGANATQVWSRDLTDNGVPTGLPQLVTRGSQLNHGGNDGSHFVDASTDGRFALVQSQATDLTAPLTHHASWSTLYRVDLTTFEAEAVSANGADANNAEPFVRRPAISEDGNTVLYATRSTNLIDGFIDGNTEAYSDVFAWQDRAIGEQDVLDPKVTITTPEDNAIYRQGAQVIADYACEDEGPSGIKSCDGPVPSGQPIDTSAVGSFTFKVTATDNAGNTAFEQYTYRVAAANAKLKLVSGKGAASADAGSNTPVMNADGGYLVFLSDATNLIEGFEDNNGESRPDVYRRNLTTGETELVSAGGPRQGSDEALGNDLAVSPDGRYVVFAGTRLYLRDTQAQTTKAITGDGDTSQSYAFSADGKTVVFQSTSALDPIDDNSSDDIYTYSLETGKTTLVSVDASGKRAEGGARPAISADGRRVVFTSWGEHLLETPIDGHWAHTYWRDLTAGVTKVVDRKHSADVPATRPVDDQEPAQLSADGTIVLFGTDSEEIIPGFTVGGGDDIDQLYRRDMTTGAVTLVSSAHDDPKRGTGGELYGARLSADGTTVLWQSESHDVVKDFVDHNDRVAWSEESDLYLRRGNGPATLAAHGIEGPNHGLTYEAYAERISTDNRFVVVRIPTRTCDCERYEDDLQRLDLKRGRFTNVAAAANRPIFPVTASADTKQIAFATQADNLIDGFQDGNGFNGEDVFAWYDAPPGADVTTSVTGSLKIRFDASGSTDSDGEVQHYTWAFGDTTTGTGEVVEHTFPEEDTYEVRLTIEDDGGNEVVHTFEVVAIKGVLTTGGEPLDFIGIDKHLRCSVLRDGPVFAQGGGACGTFVALGGTTYGPPELTAGTVDYTPVSQDRTETGDVAQIVTVVALGDTGVQLRQTDSYKAGKAWYRTDVELVNAGDMAKTARVYRAARCGFGTSRRSIHDQGTSTAGCDGVTGGDRVLAAWLPLSAGARRDAGPANAVLGRVGAGEPLADTCACGAQDDPAAAIGWGVEVPAKGASKLASLATFGPDGSIPMTVDLAAEKAEVQPLDDNAFTLTLRNPNAGEQPVQELAFETDGAWDHTAGTTTGLTTADPQVEGNVAVWKHLKVGGHGTGELRFGVQHRSGERTATTKATPGTADFAFLRSTAIADHVPATATVVARSVAGSKPNTAITSGPTGITTDRSPAFQLEASKAGVSYECRFGDAAWAPCEGNPHRPGPLADGEYVLEARAVDAVGADETPARRTFLVDTAAPNTSITSGPKAVSADNRPTFFFSSSEAGARFECNLGRGWFACEGPSYRAPALPDGAYTFTVKAIDAAGNADPTPATVTFTIDTTPPVTVIDGVTGKVIGTTRTATGATASGGGSGSTVALGADGSAGVNVACPADGPACNGAVGLATQPATAAQARPGVPSTAITLVRAPFSAQPGQTVRVKLPLSKAVVNQVERVGRMAVFTTIDTGDGRPVRGSDVVLTPDPRTARLLDAGRELTVKGGKVKLRLACAAKTCRGTLKLGSNKAVKFSIKRRGSVSVPVSTSTKRGKDLAVQLKTRLAPTKRLTLTLRAQEARR